MKKYNQNQGKTCKVEGCCKPARVKGFCHPHYNSVTQHQEGGHILRTLVLDEQGQEQ